ARIREERGRQAGVLVDHRHHRRRDRGDAAPGGGADPATHGGARVRLPLLTGAVRAADAPPCARSRAPSMQTAVPLPREARTLPQPYRLFLGDVTEPGYAKTAFGLRDWAPERCIGEYACPGATVSAGLRAMTPAQAR